MIIFHKPNQRPLNRRQGSLNLHPLASRSPLMQMAVIEIFHLRVVGRRRRRTCHELRLVGWRAWNHETGR